MIDRIDIQRQRFQKKVDKLIKQRDHWKEQYDELSHILKIYPYLRQEHNRYVRDIDQRKEHEMLIKRVREQELLIRMLMKDDTLKKYEIKNAYDELVREETAKMNERFKENK